MSVLSGPELIARLGWRYAVKKFDATKTISPEDWSALEQALILTPSSFGLQPWKFCVISSPALKMQLPPISWNQLQVQEASHVVVFACLNELSESYVDAFMQRIVAVRGGDVESLSGYKRMILGSLNSANFNVREWATRQAYIALGNLMTCAAVMNIDSCPMEGIEPAKYDELLGLPEQGFHTVVACALGYRSADDKYSQAGKVRFEAQDLVQHF